MRFCDKLQQLRRIAKLTQDEFAVRIGMSRQAISKWESGVAYPDLKNLQIICDFFNISPDLLLNDERELSSENEASYHFDATDLGARIRNIRMARGIGQENLAALLGVSRQSVSKWENGVTMPKTELLLNMLKEMDTSLRELLPPVPPVEGSLPQNDEALPSTPSDEASVPSQGVRKKRRRLLFLIPIAVLLVALLTVGAILTVPMMTADPFEDLFTALFFDVDEVSGVLGRWEAEGMEITLGSGEDTVTAKVKVSDTTVTIGNLSPRPISLPRQNATKAFESSDFHYSRYSPMALTYSQYNSLMPFLEMIEKEPATTVVGLDETLENILDAASEQLTRKVKYGFADDGFALEKTVTLEADRSQISNLLNAVADEIKKNDELNRLPESFLSTEITGEDADAPEKLDTIVRNIRKELIADYQTINVKLTYTVTGGKLTRITVSEQSTDKEKVKYDSQLVFTASCSPSAAGFTVKSSDKTTLEGVSDTLETEYTYKRKESVSKTDLTLTVKSSSIMGDDKESHSYTSKETHTLSYDKKAKTFSYRHSIPELELDSKIQGVWEFNAAEGRCRFGILKWEEENTKLLDASSAIISVRALGSETLPEGDNLFTMTSETWMPIFRQLPLKKLENIYADITGRRLGLAYNKQGEPVLPSAQKLAEKYTQAFRDYLREEGTPNIPTKKIRFYSDTHDLHILLTYQASGNIKVSYTNSLSESEITDFHEATLKSGKIIVHHVEKTTRQEPTCTLTGKQFYKCTDCHKEYSVTLSELGHQYVRHTMPVVTDDGRNHVASYEQCPRCDMFFNVSINETASVYSSTWCSFSLTKSSNGGYTVVDYWRRNKDFLSIPDALAERLSINALRLDEGGNYTLIRIPSGVKKIGTNTKFSAGPQVLILPASLTEISNGVFNDTLSLHTIYYCGTEEQWNAVNLNSYRTAWKDVNVIFCPEGVPPEVAANSYFTSEKEIIALKNALQKTESADAAIAYAQTEGVRLIESGIVKAVFSDRANNTISVVGAFADGKQTVSIYSAENFSLISQITVDFEIGHADAWGGLLALFNPKDGTVTVYRQSDGSIAGSFAALTDNTTSVHQLILMDGYVYYSVQKTVYVYKVSENSLQSLLSTTGTPQMVINRSLHRLVVYSTVYSPQNTFFVDTETTEELKFYSFAPDFPWEEEFPYLTRSRRSPIEYYDPSGNRLQEAPVVELVELTHKRNERIASRIIQTDRLNVSVFYDISGTAYLQVKTVDGTQQRLDYYAKSAILLPDGTLLLYTPNGYGLVAVSL